MRAHDYEIKTERLLLRPMTVADADAVWKWVSDERVLLPEGRTCKVLSR